MDFPFSFFEKTPGEIFGIKRRYYIAYNETQPKEENGNSVSVGRNAQYNRTYC